ncbi:MAG: hypothetical protein Q4D81_14550 [Eubacteriales bacterium]|nr:hypothetical protein [Eubacteriales bacterium]
MTSLRLYVTAFLLTLGMEYPVARLFGMRGREGFLIVAAINLITNPAAVFANFYLGTLTIPFLSGTERILLRHLLIEAAVLITEALLYKRYADGLRHPWRLSAAANMTSYFLGLFLQYIH